jgi:hypothetical protein
MDASLIIDKKLREVFSYRVAMRRKEALSLPKNRSILLRSL